MYEDYRVTLDSPTAGTVIIGDGTDASHKIGMRSLSGAFDVVSKTQDVDLVHTDGVYAPPGREGARTIVVEFVIAFGGDPDAAVAALQQIRNVFGAKEDLTVTVNAPGTNHTWAGARARRLTTVLGRDLQRGLMFGQGTIICPDPTPTGGW